MSLGYVRHCLALPLLIAALATLGCQQQPPDEMQPFRAREIDYGRPLPPGALALRKIDPRDYPDFGPGFQHRPELEQAVRNSLDYLSRPSSRRYFPYGDVTHDRAVASLQAFLRVLHTARDPREFDQMIRSEFEVYQSVGCDNRGTVYFTGYYTPIFEGRKHADARFRYPIYAMPPDLVKDEEGQTIGRRNGNDVTPGYYTRQEIEQGGLARGRELAWLKDPFEAYVVTVQGSAKLRLEDGSLWELGYAANNGHEYTPVAHLLVRDRAIKAGEVSLQAMRRFFSARPDLVPHYTWKNRRFVFFKETSGGPYGSINVPVTPFYSIATDKEVFPRACLAFMQTRIPAGQPEAMAARPGMRPYAAFALDHDTGGAIRAAGRCDIYMGVGPQAEALAGHTGAEGRLYYIFLRPQNLAQAAR